MHVDVSGGEIRMKQNYAWIAVILGLGTLFFISPKEGTVSTIEGNWDISSQVEAKNYGTFLKEEHDFDYSSPDIQAVAKQIKSETSSPEKAVSETIKYTVRNVRYRGDMTIAECYDETASSTLAVGTGDCVSMTRLNVAIMRAMGIPARSVGGCLSHSKRCVAIFSVIPGLEALTVAMTEGDFKKRGYLHEWVEVWTPEKGWFLVESTSGQKFPLGCVSYLKYSYDSNRYNRCVIQDSAFWDKCGGY